MSPFEFMFSLLGLLLGLALAAVLGGLARALKARRRTRIGWLTALLGVFVSMDLVTFWAFAWAFRDKVSVSWTMLFAGFLVTATYYLAASLVFPEEPDEWQDLDAHFFANRRLVLGGVLACNVALFATVAVLIGPPPMHLQALVTSWAFFPLTTIAILTHNRGLIAGVLCVLILLYPLSAIWTPPAPAISAALGRG